MSFLLAVSKAILQQIEAGTIVLPVEYAEALRAAIELEIE